MGSMVSNLSIVMIVFKNTARNNYSFNQNQINLWLEWVVPSDNFQLKSF